MIYSHLYSLITPLLPIPKKVLIRESINLCVSKEVPFSKNLHFIHIFHCHPSFLVPFTSLRFILLLIHPLNMVIKKVLRRTGHFTNWEKAIPDIFHRFFFSLFNKRKGWLMMRISLFARTGMRVFINTTGGPRHYILFSLHLICYIL
jgi:hypothetical protein